MAHIICEENALELLTNDKLPVAVGGGANTFKDKLLFLMATRGPFWHQNETRGGRRMFEDKIKKESGQTPSSSTLYMSPYFDPEHLPLEMIPQAFTLMQAVGHYFEVISYPCFLEMSDRAYQGDVPEYVPNSTVTDENDNVTKVTWDKWIDATHTQQKMGSTNYVVLSRNNNGGHELAGSVISQLITGRYTVKHKSEWPKNENDDTPLPGL